jgi:diguanylate cyclase (GGDEF)-like protein
MPQPEEPLQLRPCAEDSFLDLLAEILEGLEGAARGQFLRGFFRMIAQLELTEAQSAECWDRIVQRRREIEKGSFRTISLKAAIVDVLGSTHLLRVPILLEYDEFRKLRINAATDGLTGLYNRRLFDEYCDKELNRAKRYHHHLAVVILDLHLLKEVNDRHGHLQGDKTLQLTAETLRKTLRASDLAFRIGGDEFALLLPQTDPEQGITLCRRVRSQYETEIGLLKLDIGVTVDFGIAVYPQDGDQKDQLLNLADERLYRLKHSAQPLPRVVPLEPEPPPREVSPSPPAPPPVSAPSKLASEAPIPTLNSGHRKWERVSLAGTKAYAILTDAGQKTAKVIDLSYGGVALLLEDMGNIPAQFNAVLHVPILPPVRVILRTAYTLPVEGSRTRVGCAFVS